MGSFLFSLEKEIDLLRQASFSAPLVSWVTMLKCCKAREWKGEKIC